jgi:hypothetical protein
MGMWQGQSVKRRAHSVKGKGSGWKQLLQGGKLSLVGWIPAVWRTGLQGKTGKTGNWLNHRNRICNRTF